MAVFGGNGATCGPPSVAPPSTLAQWGGGVKGSIAAAAMLRFEALNLDPGTSNR
jgi:hypothetical protein